MSSAAVVKERLRTLREKSEILLAVEAVRREAKEKEEKEREAADRGGVE